MNEPLLTLAHRWKPYWLKSQRSYTRAHKLSIKVPFSVPLSHSRSHSILIGWKNHRRFTRHTNFSFRRERRLLHIFHSSGYPHFGLFQIDELMSSI